MLDSEFKNSFAVESEEILFRRARKDDNFNQITSLIVRTDSYIYPFWFNNVEACQLLHNLRAKNLYHALGFREMQEIVGLDGTDTSKVEVVSMLRKKANICQKSLQ